MKITILRQFVLLAIFALVWTASACRSSGSVGERAKGQRGGEISYRLSSPPTTFNYLVLADENSLIVAFYMMGGRLVEFDHKNQRYVLGLAESLQRLDDGRTVELTLRDGIKFSDGHPITAEDVIFTLRAIYDERTASPIFRDAMMIGNRQIEVSIPNGTDGTDGKNARRLRLVFPEVAASHPRIRFQPRRATRSLRPDRRSVAGRHRRSLRRRISRARRTRHPQTQPALLEKRWCGHPVALPGSVGD